MTAVAHRFTPLAARLRLGTADLHRAVEVVADLPGSVSSRSDYADLLLTFHGIHRAVEAALDAPEWASAWRAQGIDLEAHRQLPLLSEDLAALGHPVPGPPHLDQTPGRMVLRTTAEALGALYVVEGSAIGRRLLSPLLRARLGDVPTGFFDGSRGRAQAWREVQRRLAGVADDERQLGVLAGARTTFAVFLDGLRERAGRHAPAAR